LTTKDDQGSYGQFCPVAMAAEIICARWTPLVLRELLCGTTRFNDLRRGVPRMSPTLLSKRLKQLEEVGVIVATKTAQRGVMDYKLTSAGEELRGVVMSLGVWGQRWVESSLSLKQLDASLLMWDMRRSLALASFPDRRCTVHFLYPEVTTGRKSFWLVIDQGKADLCAVDPGFNVDLYVHGSLRSMTAVWMGLSTLKAEITAGKLDVTGDKDLARTMETWLGLSVFAKETPQLPVSGKRLRQTAIAG
jgi:DNA-binding HxlR family transcriptional regulator